MPHKQTTSAAGLGDDYRLWELPAGWEWKPFRKVAEVASNLVNPLEYPDSPHIAPNHIESGTGRLLPYSTIAEDGVTSSKHKFDAGVILYSKIRPYLNKVVIAPSSGLCSADMYPITTSMDLSYLHKWMLSPTFVRWASGSQGRTVLPKINQDALGRIPVPVPPLDEQRRIAHRIDEMMERSRRVRGALKDVVDGIADLRRSFYSRLFAGGRSPTEDPPKTGMRVELDELAKMREDAWRLQASGKSNRRYKPAEFTEVEPTHALPDKWQWFTVDQLAFEVTYGTSAKTSDLSSGIPVLRMGNIVEGILETSDLKFLPVDHEEFPELLLQPGDVLFNRTNSPELVGKTAVFHGELPTASFASYLIRLRLVGLRPELLAAFLNSPYGREWISENVSQQVGQANVNGTKLRQLSIPVPPPMIQDSLVDAIRDFEQRLMVTRGVCHATFAEADRLDQAILQVAFSGQI